MKLKICISALLSVIILLYIIACHEAGEWLVKEDDLVHSDAIVMLMGSISDRVSQTNDLYKQKIANKVIIVEESMGAYKTLKERGVNIISNTSQVHDAFVTLGIPPDSIIILPGDAASTQMEATIIREYLINNSELDTLLIVSSAEHMRRAFMIFKSTLRKDGLQITVLCSPSAYTNFDEKK